MATRNTPQRPASSTPRRAPRRTVRKGRLFLLLAWIVVVIIVIVLLASGGGGAKWKAKVENYQVINPADLGVTVQVINTGTKPGRPTCTVEAQDPSYTHTGIDVVTLNDPVQPGQTATYVDNVTITRQGARYVTQVTVSC
jgi:hypothetical protein